MFEIVAALACPMLVEVFADPVDVSDAQGEFIEIRLPEGEDGYGTGGANGCTGGAAFDSLFVQFEEKSPLRFPFPAGRRLVLVHDSVLCPKGESIACGLLGGVNLPNSRETYWRTWGSSPREPLICPDSVSVPVPKVGFSLQRVKESDRWEVTPPTLGEANPRYELGVKDCGLDPLQASLQGGDSEFLWNLRFSMSGCDSSRIHYEIKDPFEGKSLTDSSDIKPFMEVEGVKGKAAWVSATLPADEASSNDRLDTMLVAPGASPIVISEIHHCPQEPEPEWVEVYNRTGHALPLDKFRFCGRGGFFARHEDDSIAPFQSIIFTKDTAALRDVLGYKDARLIQLSLGYLNNSSGSIALCFGEAVLDSVAWDKSTVSCPLGFSPITGKAEYTPGFQKSSSQKGALQKNETPFTYRLSSRMVRRNGTLRVYVESEKAVELRLLDSAGHVQWSHSAPAKSNAWWKVPLDSLSKTGVAYISLKSGTFENLVGFVLRP